MIKDLKSRINSVSLIFANFTGIDMPYYIKNGFWAVLNQGTTQILSLIISVVLARFLSVKVFGQYQYVLSIFLLLSMFSLPGLTVSIARAVARGLDQSYRKGIALNLKHSLIGTAGLVVVGFYYFYYKDIDTGLALILSTLFFPFYFTFSRWEAFLLGKEAFKLTARYKIIQALAGCLLLCASAIFFKDNLIIIILAYMLSNTAFNLLWHTSILKKVKITDIDPDCIPDGVYLSKIGILGIVVNQFDKIILGIIDVQILAVYIIAIKLLDAFTGFAKSLVSVTFPKFAKRHVSFHPKQLIIITLGCFMICILLMFMAKPVVTFFFSTKYNESIPVFEKIVFALPLIILNLILMTRANAEMDKTLIMQTRIIAPIIAITSSLIILILTKDIGFFVIGKVYLTQLTYIFFLVITKSIRRTKGNRSL